MSDKSSHSLNDSGSPGQHRRSVLPGLSQADQVAGHGAPQQLGQHGQAVSILVPGTAAEQVIGHITGQGGVPVIGSPGHVNTNGHASGPGAAQLPSNLAGGPAVYVYFGLVLHGA